MTHQSSFAPRPSRAPGLGSEADVAWRYARSLDEAMRLSRAIDQHVQGPTRSSKNPDYWPRKTRFVVIFPDGAAVSEHETSTRSN